jgi:hypothetical protein
MWISFSFHFRGGIFLFCTSLCIIIMCTFSVLIVSFFQRDIANVNNMQWCQFVVDQLHEELSNGIYSQDCIFLLEVHIYILSVKFLHFFMYFLSFLSICRTIIFVVLCFFPFHSLDVTGLDDLDLPEAEFAVNRWSRENINKVYCLMLLISISMESLR